MGVVVKELPAFEQHSPNVERITKNDAAENKFLVLFLMTCFFPAVVLVESIFSSMTTLTHLSLRGLSPLNNRKADVLQQENIGSISYLTVTLTVAAIWAP
jgi:hypothetical protein